MLAHKNQKKFKDLIKEEFTEDFIKDIFNTYEMSIEEYREECRSIQRVAEGVVASPCRDGSLQSAQAGSLQRTEE